MPLYSAIGAIISVDWATGEALEETRAALEAAGAVEPAVELGAHLVDVRFGLAAEDENDAKDVAHRYLTKAATSHGWMITQIVPEEEAGDPQGDGEGRPPEQEPDA